MKTIRSLISLSVVVTASIYAQGDPSIAQISPSSATAGGAGFTLTVDGSDGSDYSLLHTFFSVTNGLQTVVIEQTAVIEGSDGALYGTTPADFFGSLGAVFKLNKDGSDYTVLHSFGCG